MQRIATNQIKEHEFHMRNTTWTHIISLSYIPTPCSATYFFTCHFLVYLELHEILPQCSTWNIAQCLCWMSAKIYRVAPCRFWLSVCDFIMRRCEMSKSPNCKSCRRLFPVLRDRFLHRENCSDKCSTWNMTSLRYLTFPY